MNIVRNNRGVVLVFVAMGLLLFLLFLGLALDTGWLVYVRAQGQARIDSAALAAAAALIESGDRQSRAGELANTFSEKNLVVNDTVNPENVVTPMKYDETDGSLRETGGRWVLWSGSSPVCNAVRVTTSVPTPVFFAGIRNVFGAGETGQEDLTFSSVSHLPCPGIKINNVRLAPIVLAKASWSLNNCDIARPLATLNLEDPVTAAMGKTTTLRVPLQINDRITPEPVLPEELVLSLGLCSESEIASPKIVPVIDGGGVGGVKRVVGFASLCVTTEDDVAISVTLKCGEVAPKSAGTGECFGTYASNPILIR